MKSVAFYTHNQGRGMLGYFNSPSLELDGYEAD